MKKIILVGILFSIATYASAQRTRFGLKGGVNVSNLHYDNSIDPDSKVSFHVGGLAHIHLTRKFALQPELVYSVQGAEFGNDDDYDVELNYLNMPVLLQYMAGSGFRLQTGPQVGFLLGAEVENGDVEVDIEDNYDNVDFSWAFGAGYLFPSGFGVDARYNLGISNINDAGGTEIRNGVFQAGIFYQFNK